MADITLHDGQAEPFHDIFIDKEHRFVVICCSRGWGKSYFMCASAMAAVGELMMLPASVPNKNVAVIAPTFDQVTEIYNPILQYDFGIEDIATKCSFAEGKFVFPNNVTMRLLSYEAVERMRGKGYYFVFWDEVTSCTKGIDAQKAWEKVILPCINTRWSPMIADRLTAQVGFPVSPGRAIIASTPKGYDYFYGMYNYRDDDPRWSSYHYDYTSSPYLDAKEIELLAHTTDPKSYNAEYLARFEGSGNEVFYCFDRKENIDSTIEDFADDETVHCAIDFNVAIQATSIAAIRGGQIQFLDEMMGHPDTYQLAAALKAKYPNKKILAYPDPAGRARKTSAPVGVTDFNILESAGIQVLAHNKAPPIVDSVQAVNTMLCNAAKKRNMLFHPRCKNTIESMQRTRWTENNPNLATIDKTDGVEHFSDGIRYLTEYLYPIRNSRRSAVKGNSF